MAGAGEIHQGTLQYFGLGQGRLQAEGVKGGKVIAVK